MTSIFLVRHGETVWHANNRYAGRTDVALTPRGRDQAEQLAAWATGAALDGLWCSSLSRARDTAAPVAAATGLELQVDARLCELDFGRAEGLTAADMARAFPEALAGGRDEHVPRDGAAERFTEPYLRFVGELEQRGWLDGGVAEHARARAAA